MRLLGFYESQKSSLVSPAIQRRLPLSRKPAPLPVPQPDAPAAEREISPLPGTFRRDLRAAESLVPERRRLARLGGPRRRRRSPFRRFARLRQPSLPTCSARTSASGA